MLRLFFSSWSDEAVMRMMAKLQADSMENKTKTTKEHKAKYKKDKAFISLMVT